MPRSKKSLASKESQIKTRQSLNDLPPPPPPTSSPPKQVQQPLVQQVLKQSEPSRKQAQSSPPTTINQQHSGQQVLQQQQRPQPQSFVKQQQLLQQQQPPSRQPPSSCTTEQLMPHQLASLQQQTPLQQHWPPLPTQKLATSHAIKPSQPMQQQLPQQQRTLPPSKQMMQPPSQQKLADQQLPVGATQHNPGQQQLLLSLPAHVVQQLLLSQNLQMPLDIPHEKLIDLRSQGSPGDRRDRSDSRSRESAPLQLQGGRNREARRRERSLTPDRRPDRSDRKHRQHSGSRRRQRSISAGRERSVSDHRERSDARRRERSSSAERKRNSFRRSERSGSRRRERSGSRHRERADSRHRERADTRHRERADTRHREYRTSYFDPVGQRNRGFSTFRGLPILRGRGGKVLNAYQTQRKIVRTIQKRLDQEQKKDVALSYALTCPSVTSSTGCHCSHQMQQQCQTNNTQCKLYRKHCNNKCCN